MELRWNIDPDDAKYMHDSLTEIKTSHGTSILTTLRNKKVFQPINFQLTENKKGIQFIWSFNILKPDDFSFNINNWRQYFRFGHRILYRYCQQIGTHSEVISEFNQAHQL
ncbi:MAG: hypothetical protein ACWA5R_05335 [bacterium]